MNRVIREHYPIENLPADLRGDLPAHGRVSVEITLEAGGDIEAPTGQFDRHKAARRAAGERLLKLAGVAAEHDTSIEEAVARVRALRDEWD